MRVIRNGHVTFSTAYGNGILVLSAVVGKPYPLSPNETVSEIIVGSDDHTQIVTDADIHQLPPSRVIEWFEER